MNRLALLVVVLFSCLSASAKEPVDPALNAYTPMQWSVLVSSHGWHSLGMHQGDDYAYAYGYHDPLFGDAIMVRRATKGMSGNYVSITFLVGYVDCSGASEKSYSDFLTMSHLIDADSRDDQSVGSVPVKPGTVLSAAVVGSCDAIAKGG